MGISTLIVDDHEVVRTGLASLLADSDIDIVGQAANGKEAVEKTNELHPDVVLLDIRMPVGDGLTALQNIKSQSPETNVVMLSTYDNPTYIARAITLGASDYLLKGSGREELISSIQAAASGNPVTRSAEVRRVTGAMRTTSMPVDEEVSLTQRETQVLRHVALGLSNREIAKSLKISVETVKEHIQNILRKIQATDRTQAAVWAVKRGLV
jgi:DNA-binding NarL/FixJ family response regulator